MKIKLIKIEKNIKEHEFSDYMLELGYKCKRLKISNAQLIKTMLRHDFEAGPGMPDFLVYNSKERFLCEFKSITDVWQMHQIEWVLNNSEVPFSLAFISLSKKEQIKETEVIEEVMEIDTQFEEQMKQIQIAWNIKNYILAEYIKLHPELVGKTLWKWKYDKQRYEEEIPLDDHEEYGYCGKIPDEIGIKWNKFDELFFKDKQKQEEFIQLYKGKQLSLFNFPHIDKQ